MWIFYPAPAPPPPRMCDVMLECVISLQKQVRAYFFVVFFRRCLLLLYFYTFCWLVTFDFGYLFCLCLRDGLRETEQPTQTGSAGFFPPSIQWRHLRSYVRLLTMMQWAENKNNK